MMSFHWGGDETHLPGDTLLSLALAFKDTETTSNYRQSQVLSISCNILHIGLYIFVYNKMTSYRA